MPKYAPKKLSKKYRDALLSELSVILSNLRDSKEIFKFLRDLLSESEEVMLARRLQIAKMLLADCTYDEIRDRLKAGYNTINSVKHFLDFGWGGYLKAMRKVKIKKNT